MLLRGALWWGAECPVLGLVSEDEVGWILFAERGAWVGRQRMVQGEVGDGECCRVLTAVEVRLRERVHAVFVARPGLRDASHRCGVEGVSFCHRQWPGGDVEIEARGDECAHACVGAFPAVPRLWRPSSVWPVEQAKEQDAYGGCRVARGQKSLEESVRFRSPGSLRSR